MAKSILVVDDEPNIVLSLEFLMEKQGFEVRSAYDGEQALQAISESPPDLILLDINMPKVNGYEVCASVRGNPAWKDVRILILTAKGRDVEREKGLAMGADEYVTKPFSTREVVEKVQELLGDSVGPSRQD
jgi:two-component system alkaline phosphatase synthesis response regulator PhoP